MIFTNYIAGFIQQLTVGRVAERILFDLRQAMYVHLQRVSLAFMDKTEVGRLMSRLQGDVNALQEFLETTVYAVGDIVLLGGITVVLVMLDWKLGLFTLSVVPTLLIVRIIWLPYAREAFLRAREMSSVVNGALAEGIHGVRTIQGMRRERVNFDLFNDKVGPYVGLTIESDGSVVSSEIVKGHHAGESRAMAITPTVSAELQAYADAHAGGPGAIYVGDISQLEGPAAAKDEGDADGNVPLASLKSHNYVYESDYYKGLMEKANLTNPTELVSEGLDISIQHACVNRALGFCKIVESYFGPNLSERTNGQLNIVPSSFPELGIAGPDTLALVADGTLDMVSILGVYVAGELPGLEIQFLFGLYTSREDQYNATADLAPDLEKLVVEASGGGKLINFNWHSGDDIFLFTNRALRSSEDLVGLKVRSFGTAIADWIKGMGADAQFMAFSEVYTALERGVIDAGVTGGDAGHGQRWYEVTDYINGPLIAWPSSLNIMNENIWSGIPEDLQQIMIEEGAKSELEALRIGSIQNELGLEKNIQAGMEFVEFNDEMRALSDRSVMESVVPNWVDRVGGPEQDIVRVFNEKIGTIIGLKIETDGSIVRTGE